jgi:hypothetical protein
VAPPETRANPLSGSWVYCTRLGSNSQRNARKNSLPVVLKPQIGDDAWKRNNARKSPGLPLAKIRFFGLISSDPMKKAASRSGFLWNPHRERVLERL